MFPEWSLTICLLCNKKPSTSYEHMIPDSIGGTLEVKLLCPECNKDLGTRIVGTVKKDLMIRLAIKTLEKDIFSVYKRFEEGQPYVGQIASGDRIRFKRKGNSFSPRYSKLKDSEIMDTRDVPKHVRSQMTKEGASESEINEAIKKLSRIAPNERVPLTSNIYAAKPTIQNFNIDYSHQDVHDHFPLLVSYEFLGLVLGKSIYDEYFDHVRNCLVSGSPCNIARIERFRTNTEGYRPIHTIMLRNDPSSTTVDLILFDWIWYRTTFLNLCTHAHSFIYRDIIPEKRIEVAESPKDAEDGKFSDFLWTKYPPN